MDSLPPAFDLCLFLAGVPPASTTPNFDNPNTLALALIAVCVIMIFGAVLFTTYRLIANRRKLRWSDCKKALALPPNLSNMAECSRTDMVDQCDRLCILCPDFI